MISSMAIVGLVFIVLSVGFLGYVNSLYAAHDREVAAERARAGLGPLTPTAGATPLVGAFLALGGAGTALGVVLVALSAAILF